MKATLLLFFVLVFQLNTNAQEVVAKFKFGEAEDFFNNGKYSSALQNLHEVDSILGKPTQRTLYLAIQVYDKMVKDNPFNNVELFTKMEEAYTYYLKNYEATDEAKYIDVYKISERYRKLGYDPKLFSDAVAGDAKSLYDLGVLCERAGYYCGSGRLYTQSAEKDYKKAVIKMAFIDYYAETYCLREDTVKTAFYLNRAAEAGDWFATLILYRNYLEGKGVAKDGVKAKAYAEKGIPLTRKAAEEGDAYAMVYMGVIYNEGWAIDKDDKTALQWYKKFAGTNPEQNHYLFLKSVKKWISKLENRVKYTQEGDEKFAAGNFSEAAESYIKADNSQLNNKIALSYKNIGKQYFENKQYQEALPNYQKAIKYNKNDADLNLRLSETEKIVKEEDTYNMAKFRNDFSNYEIYAELYPEGKYIASVNEFLEKNYQSAVQLCMSSNDYKMAQSFCQKYLKRFPNGKFAEEANKKLKLCNRKLK